MPVPVSHVVEGLSYLVNFVIHVICNGNSVCFGQVSGLGALSSWCLLYTLSRSHSQCGTFSEEADSVSQLDMAVQGADFMSLLGLIRPL
jgi:hypothetical protein